MFEQERRGGRSAKASCQVERSPTVCGCLINQESILAEQGLKRAAIAHGRGFKEIDLGQVGDQEVADQRLAGVNRPQKSGDSLAVSACDERWFLLGRGGDFSRFALPDKVEKALAHASL